ncbi:MAG: dienelactone hydrolase family protein [Phycisphaeraceae bacterium]
MPKMNAHDFDQELLILFDAYVHGSIDRRTFLNRAARFAVGGMTAAGLLAALSPKFAEAQQVKPDDDRLQSESVEYPSPQGYDQTRGYLVRPAEAEGKLPGVLVVHENRGLNPHIEDVTRRLALEGFLAFAPDALAPRGGYPGDEDKAREQFATLDQAKTRQDMLAAAAYLKQHPACTGRIGAVGFCWGGGITMMLATQMDDLAAAVPFYGNHPPAEQAENVKAPLLIHYAENDPRINAGREAWEAALQAADVAYTAHSYPGTQHGFHNDTTPRYDEAAARRAWQRTVAFFEEHLRR